MQYESLLANEFCNSLAIHYGCSPTRVQPTCDRCSAAFTAWCTFSCARLVISGHNELCDEFFDMASKTSPPLMVPGEPNINSCCTFKNGNIKPTTETEDRGDVLRLYAVKPWPYQLFCGTLSVMRFRYMFIVSPVSFLTVIQMYADEFHLLIHFLSQRRCIVVN
jgi:hypothetical protein